MFLSILIYACLPILIMGKMNVILQDKTEERFRRAVADYKGFKKGNLSEALEEAIDLWIKAKAIERAAKLK